jgi:hypothetical protein
MEIVGGLINSGDFQRNNLTLNSHKIIIFLFLQFVLSFYSFAQDINFDYSRYNVKPDEDIIRLRLQNIGTISGNYILIGGVYETDVLPLHPVVFMSNNRGVSWKEMKFNCEGAGISNIKAISKSNVWFIVERQEEGAYLPEYLLKCMNDGTIDFYPFNVIGFMDGIVRISFMEFYDDNNGLFNVIGSAGQMASFFTKNGGKEWSKLWNVDNYLECNYEYPDNDSNYFKSTYSTMFDSIGSMATIQYRETNEFYLIEIYDYSNRNWTLLSKIPTLYKLNSSGKIFKVDEL